MLRINLRELWSVMDSRKEKNQCHTTIATVRDSAATVDEIHQHVGTETQLLENDYIGGRFSDSCRSIG